MGGDVRRGLRGHARRLRRHRARRRPRGHAQLHRRTHQRELLGHRGARHRRRFHRDIHPRPGRVSKRGRHRGADPRRRLRHQSSEGEGLKGTAPHAGRLRAARELCRRHRGRPGLWANQIQGLLAQRPARRCRAGDLQHSGHRRHVQERGAWHRGGENSCYPEAQPSSVSPCPPTTLVVGLQCGGSDGYSGISANPAPGRGGGPGGAPRRHGRAVRNARDLRW